MDKIVIFCEHAVETLTFFSRQLAASFEQWGYRIFWMDFDMLGLSAWKLRQAAKAKEAVLITFNFIGLSGEEELWELDEECVPVKSIWEKLGVSCLNIMVDHPIYYYKQLQHPVPGMRFFCVDREHVAYMERFYPELPCAFLPLAGNTLPGSKTTPEANALPGSKTTPGANALPGSKTPSGANALPEVEVWPKTQSRPGTEASRVSSDEPFGQWLKRPYGLVFTANYVPLQNIERQFKNLEPEYRDFYYEVIDAFIRHPEQGLLQCIETYLRREMPDISDAKLCEGMSSMPAVDLWIRTHFREKTVRALAEGGIQVHVFGKDWDKMPCARPENLVCTGHMVGSADCVQAMAKGKLALNTMPWFKDGAHDRVFTAMLQGAAAFTDGSSYLKERFVHMDSVVYYDLCSLEELPQQVRALLAEPEQLYGIACRGKTLAGQSHTWECRAKVLKRYLDGNMG